MVKTYAITNQEAPVFRPPNQPDVLGPLPGGWYQGGMDQYGPYLATVHPKGDEAIRIKGSLADLIIEDIALFLTKHDHYTSFGLVHKRGILLYGPPGTGKSTIGRQIGDEFAKSGGLVFHCTNKALLHRGISARENLCDGRQALFILEDMEDWIDDSGVLNVLDGATALTNVVFLGMTNSLGDLPERIVNRPGRFDRVELIDHIDENVQIEMLRRIEKRVPGTEVARVIVEGLSGLAVTPAHLREAFTAYMILGTPIAEIRKRYEKMVKLYKTGTR